MMKLRNAIAAALVLAGTLSTTTFAAADDEISKGTLSSGNYCHLKFPAIREETLSWDRPVLKHPSEGDIIDFYGPCDYDPRGKSEVQSQRRDRAELYDND
jgi:hypothetical protein